MGKLLIVYYSWSNGNTRRVAQMLQKATGADIMEIKTVAPYVGSYEEVVEQGQREVNQGYQPEIQKLPYHIADYDTIAVGTPTWWYTMAPAVLTFLKGNDWSGKQMIPFATNGGWPGHVIQDMKAACKGAGAICEMQVQFDSGGGNHLETSGEEIDAWVKGVKEVLE